MQKQGKEKKLLFSVGLDDCDIKGVTSNRSCGGSGKDTSNNMIQLVHKPSGVRTTAQEQRSQFANKKEAFFKMAKHPKFIQWCQLEASRILGKPSIDDIVDKQMGRNNLKIEVKDENGRWKEIDIFEFERLQKDGAII